MTEPTNPAARKPRPGLGRGLSALLGDVQRVDEPGATGQVQASGVRQLPVGSLVPHPGPRIRPAPPARGP